MSENHNLLVDNILKLEITKIEEVISSLNIRFKELIGRDEETATELYEFVLNKNLFEINAHNLDTILGEDFKSKSYTTILEYPNNNVVVYLKNAIAEAVKLFPETSTEESKDAIIQLINDSKLSADFKISYIDKQTAILDNLDGISVEYEDISFKTNHIKPTWDNIIDSYIHSEKKLTVPLKNFIETHYQALQSEKVVARGEDNPTGSLFASLFANNNMPLDIYRALVGQFNVQYTKRDLSGLESDRMAALVLKNKIAYTGYNISMLCSKFNSGIFGNFLINRFDDFLEDNETEVEINNEVGAYILRSELSLNKKILFLNQRVAEIENDKDTVNFANEICFYYAEAGIDSDSNIELIKVAVGKANSWINKIRVINSINASLGYEKDRIFHMLKNLGYEYAKLNSYRKRPRFDNNTENNSLISFLAANNHISSYEVVDNSINVVCLYP